MAKKDRWLSVRCIERGRASAAGCKRLPSLVRIKESFLSHAPSPLVRIIAGNFRKTLWLDLESECEGPMLKCPAKSKAFTASPSAHK